MLVIAKLLKENDQGMPTSCVKSANQQQHYIVAAPELDNAFRCQDM